MIFSNSCQYAIKSCVYLSNHRNKIEVKEIAEYINSPVYFTSKILQKLTKNGIISSSKGKSGGFFLSEMQYNNNKIKDIFLVFEDSSKLNKCYLGLSQCENSNPCPVHHIIVHIKEQVNKVLNLKINEIKNIGEVKYIK